MRLSAKAFVVDDAGRLLLLDCVDPARPGVRWWELPGGGVEPGESDVQAVVREVGEETGLTVEASAVGPLVWTQETSFLHRGRRHFSRCHGYVAHVSRSPAQQALTEEEQDVILGSRWWTPSELAATSDRFFPRNVPTLLPRVLAGERVDEPFDDWEA